MEDWMNEFKDTFLKVGEGTHELTIYGPPEKIESKWKNSDGSARVQWVFKSASLNGLLGDLAPSKGLGRIIKARVMLNESMALKSGKTARDAYPAKIKFSRVGMGSESTKFTVLE